MECGGFYGVGVLVRCNAVTPFIPPRLSERLTNPRKLADRHDIAEPKLDGQRAQLVCWRVMPSEMLRHPLVSQVELTTRPEATRLSLPSPQTDG